MEDGNKNAARELRFYSLRGSALSENHTQFHSNGEELSVDVVVKTGTSTSGKVVVQHTEGQKTLFTVPVTSTTVFRMLPKKFVLRDIDQGMAFCLSCATEVDADRLDVALQSATKAVGQEAESWFDRKTEKSSSESYFHYYGMLQHQQNMLQDCVRTGTYYMAFVRNTADFQGKAVMDVGAGSGMLSLFAAQAGAKKVYAIEASPMARYAQLLVQKNPVSGCAIEVFEKKIEELQLEEKMDVLISEPIGTLLVNERMLETYIFARDHFLKPGGKMFPTVGRIHMALFSDDNLYQEILSKATFWLQQNFYGVNLTFLHAEALNQYFTQVVVDAFDPALLVSNTNMHVMDFTSIAEEDLYDFQIPLNFSVGRPCVVHGVACWFDIFFDGSTKGEWLTTAPGCATTHWFQLRCVLPQPLCAVSGTQIAGIFKLKAHSKQSYHLDLALEIPAPAEGLQPQKMEFSYDLKEPYYRQLMNYWQTHISPSSQHPSDGMYADRHSY